MESQGKSGKGSGRARGKTWSRMARGAGMSLATLAVVSGAAVHIYNSQCERISSLSVKLGSSTASVPASLDPRISLRAATLYVDAAAPGGRAFRICPRRALNSELEATGVAVEGKYLPMIQKTWGEDLGLIVVQPRVPTPRPHGHAAPGVVTHVTRGAYIYELRDAAGSLIWHADCAQPQAAGRPALFCSLTFPITDELDAHLFIAPHRVPLDRWTLASEEVARALQPYFR
jgi:hypothetical protein